MTCLSPPIILLYHVRRKTVLFSIAYPVPDVTVEGNKVTAVIGSVVHPMVEEHYIEFIALETNNGVHVRFLEPGQEPKAVFELNGEEPVAVYEYCNLHGLWKKDI